MKEHDVVRAIEDIEIEGKKIAKGTKGTIVHVYRNGYAVAVEFPVVITVLIDQIKTISN